MIPRRPPPQAPSAYEMMELMEERRRKEASQARRGLDWAMLLVFFGAIGLTCVPGFRSAPSIIIVPAMLLMVLLAIVMLAKGGIGSGLAGLFFAVIALPLWGFIGPSMIEGVHRAGSLDAYAQELRAETVERRATPPLHRTLPVRSEDGARN